MRAAVVALADLGRSARMQYHARALAGSSVDVDFVGYEGTPLPRAVVDDGRITVHRFTPSMARIGQTSSVKYALLAVVDNLRVVFSLWREVRADPRPRPPPRPGPPAASPAPAPPLH